MWLYVGTKGHRTRSCTSDVKIKAVGNVYIEMRDKLMSVSRLNTTINCQLRFI